MGDKNKIEPNPFPFKCLEFTLFLEWYCQRTYLRGCCNKSIQQRRGRDAECRSCSALSKLCPGKMPSCPDCSVSHPHLLDNSHQMAQALSFAIQKLLLLCWMAECCPLMLPSCRPALCCGMLMMPSKITPRWDCHIQLRHCLHHSLISNPPAWAQSSHSGCWCSLEVQLGRTQTLRTVLFPLLQSDHLTRNHLSLRKA